jgi:hypothetical protein
MYMSRTPHWPFGANLWLLMFILHLSSRHTRHDLGGQRQVAQRSIRLTGYHHRAQNEVMKQ